MKQKRWEKGVARATAVLALWLVTGGGGIPGPDTHPAQSATCKAKAASLPPQSQRELTSAQGFRAVCQAGYAVRCRVSDVLRGLAVEMDEKGQERGGNE